MSIQRMLGQWPLALVLAITSTALIADTRGNIEVEDAQTRLANGVFLLSADLDIELSTPPKDAMENGLPLTIVVEMQIRRIRRALWNQKIAEIESRYRIHTHPLSKRFVLRNLGSGVTKSFTSLEQMLSELGTIREFPLLDANLLEPGSRYTARIRAQLDIESLPAPLRPTAYLSPAWHISSDWYEWPIER